MNTLRYAVAKYVPDLLRQEPRNIGVFVIGNEDAASRLLGETSSGALDLRRVPFVNDRSVYAEWYAYWKAIVTRRPQNLWDELMVDKTGAYAVWPGGTLHAKRGLDAS